MGRHQRHAAGKASLTPVRVPGVDTEWVLAKIDEFMKLLDVHRKSETQEANDAVSDLLPVMEQIAAAVEPGRSHQWRSPYPVWTWSAARDTAIRLRSVVVNRAEVTAKLGPAGPQLAAVGLHPEVRAVEPERWRSPPPPDWYRRRSPYWWRAP